VIATISATKAQSSHLGPKKLEALAVTYWNPLAFQTFETFLEGLSHSPFASLSKAGLEMESVDTLVLVSGR
jgi:hypothetical protein